MLSPHPNSQGKVLNCRRVPYTVHRKSTLYSDCISCAKCPCVKHSARLGMNYAQLRKGALVVKFEPKGVAEKSWVLHYIENLPKAAFISLI